MQWHRPLNIVLSSTRQWNPGDDFICDGVKWLVKRHASRDINWRLWNRNPDLSVDGFADCNYRQGILSNVFTGTDFSQIDAIILAGTPEWYGPRLEPLFEAALARPDLLLLMIGVGSNFRLTELPRLCREVIQRKLTFISTRSQQLCDDINIICDVSKVRAITCPAFYCATDTRSRAKINKKNKTALILQIPTTGLHSISSQYYNSVRDAVLQSAGTIDYDLVAFYDGEFERLQSDFQGHDVRYCENPNDYYELLRPYSSIVSTRLHGAICGLSMRIPTTLLDRGNFRLATTASLFSQILPVLPIDAALAWSNQAAKTGQSRWVKQVDGLTSQSVLEYGHHFKIAFEMLGSKLITTGDSSELAS